MRAIIITSIFAPTEAVQAFSKVTNTQLFVVGDRKTPQDWSCPNTIYISTEDQEHSEYNISKNLPHNHYCRKMFGYLWAIKMGAIEIIDTDDDNIPKEDWDFPPFTGTFTCTEENLGFINTYSFFTTQKIWPRGLPLRNINDPDSWKNSLKQEKTKVGVWQGLADEDPDVDAIYRLTDGRPCFFETQSPIVLGQKTISPFNTQNTLIRKELFPLLYLPTYVTFRYTDILRGLIAQPIMWLYDYKLGFTQATVTQKRNLHDFFHDFISEIPMYESSEKVIEIVSGAISSKNTISENLHLAYCALSKEKIVDNRELHTLNAWLDDINRLMQ